MRIKSRLKDDIGSSKSTLGVETPRTVPPNFNSSNLSSCKESTRASVIVRSKCPSMLVRVWASNHGVNDS